MLAETVVKKGDWVLLRNDTPIASDSDLSKILKEYERHGENEVVISKEPSSENCYY